MTGAVLHSGDMLEPDSYVPLVADESLRLRGLTDLTTDALGKPRVGTAPPALIRLILGRTLVASLTTSLRIDGARIGRELGWSPAHPRFRDAVVATVAATP